MAEVITVIRNLETEEAAEVFASHTGGKRNGTAVSFQATYSISKARYSIKRNKYVVYIRIYPVEPENCQRLTICVYADTSQKAYDNARQKLKDGDLYAWE